MARAFDLTHAAVLAAAAVIGVAAFAASAQQHALDLLIAQGACGNPGSLTGPLFLGHCMACWLSGGSATAIAMAVGLGALAAFRRRPRPAVA